MRLSLFAKDNRISSIQQDPGMVKIDPMLQQKQPTESLSGRVILSSEINIKETLSKNAKNFRDGLKSIEDNDVPENNAH